MPTRHIKPDDIAAPIDIRLIPAVILTVLISYMGPNLNGQLLKQLPLLLPAVGLLSTVSIWVTRHKLHRNIYRIGLLTAIACWLATPATIMVSQQHTAGEISGWHKFVETSGTARMSVVLTTDPIQRDGPFGTTWFATAEVQHYGQDLVATPHPAKIIVSADDTWAELSAQEEACFIGRITDNQTAIFVQALTTAQSGSCHSGPIPPVQTGRDVIRSTLRNQAANTVSYGPELLPGLILGDRSQQSEQLDQAMKISGLSHLSAVSGAHTSLIASAATLLLRSLRLPRPIVIAAFLGTLVLFVQIVGTQPSVIRAATMGAIGAWAVFFGRGSQALPILSLTTIIILSVAPELIHDVGFQLSVSATAGIIVGAQPLEQWIKQILKRFLPDFLAAMLSSSFAISAAAQIACQPLLLSFVDYVSPYSLLANIFATPLLPFITIPGTLAAGLCVILPQVSQLLLHLVALPTGAIGWIANITTDLPGATLPWPTGVAGKLLIILHWTASAIVFNVLLRKQREPRPPVRLDSPKPRWLRLIHASQQHLTAKILTQYVIVTVTVAAHIAVFWPDTKTIPPDWDIIGCDVGQGDMFLVRSGPASAIVIDTGPDEKLARDCLEQAQLEQIDLAVITHLHSDHVGGLPGILDDVNSRNIMYSTGTDPSYRPENNGIPENAQQVDQPLIGIIDHAQDDETHPVQIRWSILSANNETPNENNASIVLYLEIYRRGVITTALFTGDLEEDGAQEVLSKPNFPQHIDILKLSHHGAKNGGTAIIEQTRPHIALVGVGKNNSYGHPHEDILMALGPNVEIYRTDNHGTFGLKIEPSTTYVAAKR